MDTIVETGFHFNREGDFKRMNAKTVLGNAIDWKFLTVMVAICIYALATQAFAQDQHSGPKPQAQPQTDFSVRDLEKFVQAQSAVEKLRVEFAQELQEISDNEKAIRLQRQYGRKMAEAVEETGLSVQKYNKIVKAKKIDSEVKEKIESLSD